jgi:hypothetical protein
MASSSASEVQKKAANRKHERMLAWKKVYKNWSSEEAHKLVWETEPWLDAFSQASRHKDGDSLRALRYAKDLKSPPAPVLCSNGLQVIVGPLVALGLSVWRFYRL